MKEFVDYVMSFYGKGGLYDIAANSLEASFATGVCVERYKREGKSFEGDSIDREAVRDIIIELREKA